MRRTVSAAGAALVAALVVGLPGALARPAAEPGITATRILLGGTASLTGPLSASAAVVRGTDAYLRWVNARGGVHGRRIVYRYLDDASDAAQATQASRQLVEEDGVFALVSSTGTEQGLAARGYLNEAGVPQLFAASGASALGRDYRRYPWTITAAPRVPQGAVSLAHLKDATDPRWTDDAGARLYRSIMSRYARGQDARDLLHAHGMAVAYTLVQVLRSAGPEPTRAGVLAAARRLRDASNPFLLPGIAVRTSRTDPFPVEQGVLQRRSGRSWRLFGGLWDVS